ncbi:GAD-like domain-containing protein [Acetobacter thailandicus]|nr:GAD-like domain-containing protein [Acetobacter thailandicus]NHN95358.1 DUF1851 domain-containing protein [Acetobacter thailandicus]
MNSKEEKMADTYPKFDIRKYIKKYGELNYRKDVPEKICEKYKGKLPNDLILFWQEYGIGTWLNGKFQFCIPSDYSGIVDILFSGDPDIIPEKTHIIGYSAFGDLLIWNERFQRCEVSLPYLTMSIPKIDFNTFGTENFPLSTVVAGIKYPEYFYIEPSDDQYPSLFEEAVDKIGEVTLDKCYGFFPALALGGSASVKHIQIVDARVHFILLAQMGNLRILRENEQDNTEFVRNAGETTS